MTRAQAQVRLDMDRKRRPDPWWIEKMLARAGYILIGYQEARSPSGNGWHVMLDVEPRPRTALEVVALQLLLGSDPYREAMQFHRARAFARVPHWMRDAWNVLYAPDSRRQRKLKLRRL